VVSGVVLADSGPEAPQAAIAGDAVIASSRAPMRGSPVMREITSHRQAASTHARQ